ncbi:MAG: DUF167 domain-containing protein [Sphingobacteriia bacterium]|nr:DUF167 domain-containing protein [Sphingobacteriia bacterium]
MNFFYEIRPGKIILSLKISTNASVTKIGNLEPLSDNKFALKLQINAKPKDNEANNEIISLISKLTKIPKSKISFVSGEKSKIKKLAIETEDYTLIDKLIK